LVAEGRVRGVGRETVEDAREYGRVQQGVGVVEAVGAPEEDLVGLEALDGGVQVGRVLEDGLLVMVVVGQAAREDADRRRGEDAGKALPEGEDLG